MSIPPGVSEIAESIWEAITTPANPEHKLPPVLKEILRTGLSAIDSETVDESPLSIIPRIFSRDLLAPFMSHEDGAVRKAALDQIDLIRQRTGA